MLIRSGRHDFPEHAQTFEEKMARRCREVVEDTKRPVNIGVDSVPSVRDRSKMISVVNENRRNKDLEQSARLRKLKVSLESVRRDWINELGPLHIQTLAEHYGVFKDLFNGDFFTPVVNLKVCFDYQDDLVTPVYYGNRIPPTDGSRQPLVSYSSDDKTLWTLLMTNPDGHLTDHTAEYVHWLVGNIPGSNISAGDQLVDYIQPFPAKGTGWQRYIFVLFEQNNRIDFTKHIRTSPCNNLQSRTHSTTEFFSSYRDHLTPKGLAFFQSEWDESVRQVFHKFFDTEEPVYEYAHPPPYHPPPKKYPHKEPFDRYFDRYRDKKDIAEEVLRMKLGVISPFERHPLPEEYPLIHREKKYKPTWLKLREELMHRRVEQYKDLP